MGSIANRWGVRAAALAALTGMAAAGLVGGSASGARVDPVAAPQAFLLKLDSSSSARAFRQSRDRGLASARAAARDQKSEIVSSQAEVIDELPADADVIYRTHTVLAGIGVVAPADEKSLLEEIPGVAAVYPVAPKRIDNSYAVPFQGAPTAWQATGFLGQGERIAVVDTGVDYTHSGFGGPGTKLAYDEAHADEDQAADPALFPSAKVVGGFDLVGDGYNADPTDPAYQPVPHPDPNPLDCNGHGSHVAGSAAGYGVNADGSTYSGPYDGSTDFAGMRIGPGMAPRADVFAIKVFGCEGSSSVIAEAIDRAADPNGDGDPSDGADVINLSVGSDYGSVQDGDSVAANAAAALGVTVVASAGNAGDITDVSGSPGDASRVLSVASSVDAQSRMDGAEVEIDGTPHKYGISRSHLFAWRDGDLSGPVVAAPSGNATACSPYPDHAFDGKVVLVDWHDAEPECGSVARSKNLADAGAIGFIFGSDSETFSADITGSAEIPGVLMVASGADAIRTALDASQTVDVTGTETGSVLLSRPGDDDMVSGFSSRGIHATGNVKPDVTAVGSSVFSNAVGSGDEGISFSGTSMASPMVAGLSALVRQAHPGWTPLQVKADVMNTAGHELRVGGSGDPGSDRYGPVRVGAGRIDAPDAVANDVLAFNPENGSVSVSFGPVAAVDPLVLERQVTVESHAASSRTYDVSYDPIAEVPGADFSVSPATVTVAPGQSETVTVSLEIDPAELTKAVDPTIGRLGTDDYPRDTLAEAMGRLLLEPTTTAATLRVPVYAAPRPASEMSQPASLTFRRGTDGGARNVATLNLAGRGVGIESGENGVDNGDPDDDVRSLAAGFELQATSGLTPECDGEIENGCYRLPEERDVDLSMVGYTADDESGYFALAVHAPWSIPSDKVFFQVDIDVDGDDAPDLFLYNDRLGESDVFVSTLVDPSRPGGERIVDQQLINGRFGDIDTAIYDSDVIVLPLGLEALAQYGIDADNPRISYGVETYSAFSDQAIDLLGVDPDSGDLHEPLSADLFEPGITVGDGLLLLDRPGRQLTVTRDSDSYEADRGQGLMMVHFHNPVGDKAQIVDLPRLPSMTVATVSPNAIQARVSSLVGDGPVARGRVAFSLDGKEIGAADLVGGSATLAWKVPRGFPHRVLAQYSGSPDLEPSSGQVTRRDPSLTARIVGGRPNSRGWYRTAVRVEFSCTPRGSALTAPCPSARRIARDGKVPVSVTIRAEDGGSATVRPVVKVDRTRPTVRLRGVRRGTLYRRLKRPRCVARDRTSGVLRCRTRRVRRGGKVIYVAKAVDRAGNVRTVRVPTRLR
ncbi:MAG: S8 family serine peptidase [Solirubrobacterales bacterium]|nr:S8 family serine peptidase [Solirubrobacterales bacterium]